MGSSSSSSPDSPTNLPVKPPMLHHLSSSPGNVETLLNIVASLGAEKETEASKLCESQKGFKKVTEELLKMSESITVAIKNHQVANLHTLAMSLAGSDLKTLSNFEKKISTHAKKIAEIDRALRKAKTAIDTILNSTVSQPEETTEEEVLPEQEGLDSEGKTKPATSPILNPLPSSEDPNPLNFVRDLQTGKPCLLHQPT